MFDRRYGWETSFWDAGATRCFRCQRPLNDADPAGEHSISSEYCSYCSKRPDQQMAQNIARRHEAIHRAITPLPGSQPRDNYKPLNIPKDCDGKTLLEAVCRMVKSMSRGYWEAECAQGRVVNLEQQAISSEHVVRAGQRYRHLFLNVTEPDVNGAVEILHEDEALIVMNKSAPLPMHPGGRYYQNTLQHILNTAYHPQRPHPAHRLDANTTGVVLATRTRNFAGQLQPQFGRGQVEKTYLVRVQGQPEANVFRCEARISVESRELGSRSVDENSGQPACTDFRVLSRRSNSTALLEARPLTGRTNQIRVHLWHLGFPVVGDPVYVPGKKLGDTQTLSISDPAMCLHAWRIKFAHPLSQQPMEFLAPPPAWSRAG